MMLARRRNLCIKLSLGINLCVLLYLAVQFWDTPSLLSGTFQELDQESGVPLGLSMQAADNAANNKRTLNSMSRDNQSNTNQVTTLPSGVTAGAVVRRTPIHCFEKDMRPRTAMRGQYWVLYNYVAGKQHFACNESMTYTTHCDHTFLDNLVPLAKRWQGPISVGIYTPGSDYEDALKAVFYYRQCVNESQMIQDLVSFHFYFPYKHRPKEDLIWSQDVLTKYTVDCSLPPPTSSNTYRKVHSLTYPVNVGRNVARESANTHYIFPSDIELYPSPKLIPTFLDMITRGDEEALARPNPKVFVSSIFEIKEGHDLPETKGELLKLLKSQVVIPFHKMVCTQCHAIPKAKEWRTAKGPLTEDMHVFHIGKRNPPFQHWEPIYIGTHDDPLYDERLSWEGRSDKMTQGYQLCVMDYDFLILNNAFLIHRPGIKTAKENMNHTDRAKVSAQNDLIRKMIMPELKQLYGSRKGCEK
jgi:hypothetical protein